MKFDFTLFFCLAVAVASTSSVSMSVNEYFPEIDFDTSKVTWAHAVNSRLHLQEALKDPRMMMLEADILMGSHISSDEILPIMAHPPANTSDLTFAQFLDTVIDATKEKRVRKGIKLDFKDLHAVEPCLKMLKERLEEPGAPTFPVFINADILSGPVNAPKEPLDAKTFISLANEYTPFAVLSVGWTTRFGNDDGKGASDGSKQFQEIHKAEYTKEHMKEMKRVIRDFAGDTPVFPHITFPIRAGIAVQSVEALFYIKSRISKTSFTIWSPSDDPVDLEKLRSLIDQLGKRNCFIDLPFSIYESDDDSANFVESIEDEEKVKQDEPHPHRHHHGEAGVVGRVQPEEHQESVHNSTNFLSVTTAIPVIAIGLLTAFFVYRNL